MARYSSLTTTAAIVLASTLMSPGAFALCSGAASPIALDSFNEAPLGWLDTNKGKGDIGAKAQALAAAATNSNNSDFGKSLAAVLGSASGDDGAAIGSALGGLVKTCSDPKDPGDRADKQYITSNIERNLLTNTAANAAYGQQGGPETAAAASAPSAGTGGGGGGGSSSGTGSTGDGLPTGGINSGFINDGSTFTPNNIGSLPSGSVGAIGPSGFTTASDSQPASALALTQSALGSYGIGSNILLCYGTVNICGNTINGSNITVGVFNGSNSSQSVSQVIAY